MSIAKLDRDEMKVQYGDRRRYSSGMVPAEIDIALLVEKINEIIDAVNGTEPRTYKCFCGAQFTVRFPENCRWDEYEAQTLEDAGWVLRGREYRCPLHAENES